MYRDYIEIDTNIGLICLFEITKSDLEKFKN